MATDFEVWYKKADMVCYELAGVSIDDLADGPSRDAFDDGATPAEYARELLENEGFGF